MHNQKVTLKNIAEYVGTSVNTVSLALRDSERISKQMRLRIQQLAKELDYVPNYAAQALASNKSGIIGVYTHSLYDAVRVKLVDYLITELHTQSYKPMLVLGKGHDGPWYTSPWMQSFQSLNVDAVVIIAEEYGRIPDRHTGKPTIFVACQPSGDLQCDYLALDRKEAARIGVEHLVSCGHKEILIACTKESIDFEQGAIDALEAAKLKRNKCTIENNNDLQKLVDQIKNISKQTTAVLFGDSSMAADFIQRIQQQGLKVPSDVAVVGYDYLPWADKITVPLTTIDQPIEEIAHNTVKIVEQRLASPDSTFVREIYKHKLTARQSTS